MPRLPTIRARLLAAFFGISAFAVLAAVAAMYAFFEVSRSLDHIAERRVPPALASQDLVLLVERMLAAAPVVLQVTTEPEFERVSEKVDGDVARLYELLGEVEAKRVESDDLPTIRALVERLELNLISLKAIAFNNLSLVEQRRDLIQQLFFTHSEAQGLLATSYVILDARVSQLRQKIAAESPDAPAHSEAMAELIHAFDELRPLEQTRLVLSMVNDELLKAASADSRAGLAQAADPLNAALAQLEALVGGLDPDLQARLAHSMEQIRSFAKGRDSILLVREREIESVEGQELLSKNADIVHELTASLQALVAGARRDIAQASRQARSVQRYGSITLVAVVALSLISSGLIVWLYVDRHLLARLGALKHSMLAIAGGNLEADLPPAGNDEIGDMARALAVFRDTAIEVEDGHLREMAAARQQLEDAIESIADGFALYDRDDRLVLCNARYRELTRTGEDDHLQAGSRFEETMRRMAESGKVPAAIGREELWVSERMVRHHNPGGPHVERRQGGGWLRVTESRSTDGGLVCVYTDISELKRAESELREILETSPLAVGIIRQGTFVFANSRVAELAGLPRDRLLNARAEDFYEDPELLRNVLAKVAEQGYVRDVEVRFRRHGGPGFWGLLWANRVTYQGQSAHVGWTSDISYMKEAEAALRVAKEQAESANRMKSQFLANMSHEFRTPLNAILGYTELVADGVYGELPEKVREAIGRIERNGRQLLGHINDVLDISKIEAGQLDLNLGDYSMKELVETVVVALESLAAEKRLQLRADVDPGLPLGRGDEHRLTQVLMNLVGNALKFTDAGRVDIRVARRDGSFLVQVSDTGIGIAEADRERIFEEFSQADSSSTRRAGGTGLGLAIARRIVELQGGQMWVESELAVGSTFSFTVPIRHRAGETA